MLLQDVKTKKKRKKSKCSSLEEPRGRQLPPPPPKKTPKNMELRVFHGTDKAGVPKRETLTTSTTAGDNSTLGGFTTHKWGIFQGSSGPRSDGCKQPRCAPMDCPREKSHTSL